MTKTQLMATLYAAGTGLFTTATALEHGTITALMVLAILSFAAAFIVLICSIAKDVSK